MAEKIARQQHPLPLRDAPGLERIIFFSDAVFAIAITLLVLEIRLPAGTAAGEGMLSSRQLLDGLLAIWPQYLAYVISFLVIGSFWMGHHRKFRLIDAYDRWLMLMNLVLLMAVAFIPFPTAVLSEFGNRTATIFYAACIAVIGLLNTALWVYAAGARLIQAETPALQIKYETIRGGVVPVVFLFSIGLAFLNNTLAQYSWGLIAPALYIYQKMFPVSQEPLSNEIHSGGNG